MESDRRTALGDLASSEGVRVDLGVDRPVVVVQGLGFVGAAMATACARATDGSDATYTVVGVDLDDGSGRARVDAINAGRFPFGSSDESIDVALAAARSRGNLFATCDERAYGQADVVVVDVALDIDWRAEPPVMRTGPFESAIRAVGRHIRPGTLVLIETTVPPGATEKLVVPILAEELRSRSLDPDQVLVAHSFERVTPGADYLRSVTDSYRVYAGHTDAAARAADDFLRSVVNTEQYPIRRLASTRASEMAKVLENTFRATTIALMEEWSRFAEQIDVDLYEVAEVIRMRPTHSNIRDPGFGVGGYCLTKDPLFAQLAAQELWDLDAAFPFSVAAVRTNDRAPQIALDRLRDLLGGVLGGRRILLAGVSYRPDVADTRYSPSETFVTAAESEGALLTMTDPLLDRWPELDRHVAVQMPAPTGFDAVVFAVPHAVYRSLDLRSWLGAARPLVFDGCGVLGVEQRNTARELGCVVASTGRGVERP